MAGTILALCFNILVALIFPLGVLLYLFFKQRAQLMPMLVGILTFGVSQCLLRLPLLQLLSGQSWFVIFGTLHPVVYMLALSASAALFEEGGRYIAMRLLLKNNRTWADGVAFGLGHGGLEAGIVGAQNLLVLTTALPTVMGIAPQLLLLAGLERISAMLLHVGASLLVLWAVRHKKPLFLLLAMLLHTAFNAVLILQLAGMGIVTIELILLAFGIWILFFILRSRRICAAKKEATP